ncbi:extradiol dioxygenase [Paenibacillus selenitireducens]|uniref:Extradiol dioxygenase n=1 Tax=Paenibacillus selenitireducens TaxID=1324314 RepID=A0A1T2XMI6_9BACL|nr:VOC family protein [Paenibacillus selenitireducens]OPA81028.1 extradiol dioxygenase [Paenibacillus selenitireducens]
MTKELWINLPVEDLTRSKEFFAKLGFTFHPRHLNSEDAAGLVIGDKNFMVMLFPASTFKKFTGNEIADTKNGTEVLLSIDAESKEEVDEMIQKASEAGGTIFSKPQGQGWMYGAGFTDLDGHRWNVLYMDSSKMPEV